MLKKLVYSISALAVSFINIFAPTASPTKPPEYDPVEITDQIHQSSGQESKVYRFEKDGVSGWVKLGNDQVNQQTGLSYLLVNIEGKENQGVEVQKLPLNLSIVVDRSGSMRGQKLESVKQALKQVGQFLETEDRVSLVIYDDQVQTVLEPQMFSEERFVSAVEQVESGGSTFLEGGLRQGMDYVSEFNSQNYLNRVILLSDGLANVGEDNPEKLAQIVARQTESGLMVSTIGVGADYDEKLMSQVAISGGGNYYFMESPTKAEEIFTQEFQKASQTIATNLKVKFNLHPDFKLNQGIGYDLKSDSYFTPQNVYQGQSKYYLFEIKSEKELELGEIDLADLQISFKSSSRSYSLRLPVQVKVVSQKINVLADNQVYREYIDSYQADRFWQVYEELDKNKNDKAKQELDGLIKVLKQANTRLPGKFDSSLKEAEEKHQFVEELKEKDVNSSQEGKLFQKSNQYDSAVKRYNK